MKKKNSRNPKSKSTKKKLDKKNTFLIRR